MTTTKKVFLGGVEAEVFEPVPGLKMVSALAHPVVFEDGTEVPPNPPLAQLVKASMAEEEKERVGEATLVVAKPTPDPEAEKALRKFREEYPGIRVVSSMLSIAAFRKLFPGLVIGPVVTPDTSRLPPPEKRAFRDRWSC